MRQLRRLVSHHSISGIHINDGIYIVLCCVCVCSVRRALDGILRSLDHHVGRQLTSTNPQPGKSVQEILRSFSLCVTR